MPQPTAQELALQRTLVTSDAVIAFMMGGHPRLGARSSLAWHPKFDATFADPNGPHLCGYHSLDGVEAHEGPN